MKITTRFELGQEVYVVYAWMRPPQIDGPYVVHSCRALVTPKDTTIQYALTGLPTRIFDEGEMFDSFDRAKQIQEGLMETDNS